MVNARRMLLQQPSCFIFVQLPCMAVTTLFVMAAASRDNLSSCEDVTSLLKGIRRQRRLLCTIICLIDFKLVWATPGVAMFLLV